MKKTVAPIKIENENFAIYNFLCDLINGRILQQTDMFIKEIFLYNYYCMLCIESTGDSQLLISFMQN